MAIYSSNLIITSLSESPSRVVSLVPSTTESLLAFGLDDKLVGVTDFCPLSENTPNPSIRVGGTKTPDIDKIFELEPDLIIANQEENSQDNVDIFAEKGIPVWLSFPKTVDQAISELWTLVRIFGKERELAAQIDTLERSVEWTKLAFFNQPRLRYFCPIWKEPESGWWMTFNQDTYAHDILAYCGGENVFSQRTRRYPLEADIGDMKAEESHDRDVRYPRVNLSEMITSEPDLILLPNEPYAFGSEDVHELTVLLADSPAVSRNQIHCLDGRLITWHGIRMAEAITVLPHYFESSGCEG